MLPMPWQILRKTGSGPRKFFGQYRSIAETIAFHLSMPCRSNVTWNENIVGTKSDATCNSWKPCQMGWCENFHEAHSSILHSHAFFREIGEGDSSMEMNLCSNAVSEAHVLAGGIIFDPWLCWRWFSDMFIYMFYLFRSSILFPLRASGPTWVIYTRPFDNRKHPRILATNPKACTFWHRVLASTSTAVLHPLALHERTRMRPLLDIKVTLTC